MTTKDSAQVATYNDEQQGLTESHSQLVSINVHRKSLLKSLTYSYLLGRVDIYFSQSMKQRLPRMTQPLSKLVVACGDAAELLDMRKESRYPITVFVLMSIKLPLLFTVCFGWNYCLGIFLAIQSSSAFESYALSANTACGLISFNSVVA